MSALAGEEIAQVRQALLSVARRVFHSAFPSQLVASSIPSPTLSVLSVVKFYRELKET